MIKFSAPEEKAVKAVLISKNQKIAVKLFYAFVGLFALSLIYGIISAVANRYYTAPELFSDNMFSGLVSLCIFSLGLAVYLVYKPVKKKQLDANGHYDIVFCENSIKVLFPDEPEVEVFLNEIDEVVEYDIFYLIYCYKRKDEIICSKSAFVEGDEKAFREYFERAKKPFSQPEKKVYRSIFKKVNKEYRSGVISLVLAFMAVLLTYPFAWLTFNVFIKFVPNLLLNLMVTLLDLKLIFQILLGVLFLPLGIVATIISGVSALTLMAVPIVLLIGAVRSSVKQSKNGKRFLGILSFIFAIIAIAVSVLLVLVALLVI